MKYLFYFMLIISVHVNGQYYVRTKKNIGFSTVYNFGNSARLNPTLQVGLSRQFGRYIVPELSVKCQTNQNGLTPYSLNAGIEFRKNLIKLNQRKKGSKCLSELLEGFICPEFQYGLMSSRNTYNPAPCSIRYGFGFYHSESGASKRNQAWVTKIQFYHRSYFQNQVPNMHEFGVSLRIQHFKTYDFLK